MCAGESGDTDFEGLTAALRGKPNRLAFLAFDLLWEGHRDLRPLPLVQRRARLEALFPEPMKPLGIVPAFDDGAALLSRCERDRLEGVVSKLRAAPYRSGKRREWTKVKCAGWLAANAGRWKLFEGR